MQLLVFKYLDETCSIIYPCTNMVAHLSYNGEDFFDSCINLFKDLKSIFNVNNEESIRLIILWGQLKNRYFDVPICIKNIQQQVILERHYEEMAQEMAQKIVVDIDKIIKARLLEFSSNLDVLLIAQQVGYNIEEIDDDKID